MADINCGKVTVAEKDEIQALHLRKVALSELFLSLAKLDTELMDKLYEKVIMDVGKTTTLFQGWWDTKAKQYGWEAKNGGSWRIDFDTCEIFLVMP